MREQQDPNTVSMLVVFESEEKARAREGDPLREKALAAARTTMAEIFDGAPTFTDLVVVAEYTPKGAGKVLIVAGQSDQNGERPSE